MSCPYVEDPNPTATQSTKKDCSDTVDQGRHRRENTRRQDVTESKVLPTSLSYVLS